MTNDVLRGFKTLNHFFTLLIGNNKNEKIKNRIKL